ERNLLQQELGDIRANYITRRETSKQGLRRDLTINARPCECRKVAQFRARMANHGIGGIVGERHVAQERHPVVLHRFVRTLLAGNRGDGGADKFPESAPSRPNATPACGLVSRVMPPRVMFSNSEG